MSRNAVQVCITNQALTDLLGLTNGHRVIAVLPPSVPDILGGTARFVIEGADLPLVPDGVEPPLGRLIIKSSKVLTAEVDV